MSLFQRFTDRLAGGGQSRSTRSFAPRHVMPPARGRPEPVQRNVLLLDFNPAILEGRQPLSEVLGWNHTQGLVNEFTSDLRECSHGYVTYRVADTVVVDGFPVKEDGFIYTPESFLRCWRSRSGFHQPDGMDYGWLVRTFQLAQRVIEGGIEEIWLFGFPYAGFYESRMAGPGAFWCNAPPLLGGSFRKRVVIMGFNYERGVGEMLESWGHRAEAILAQVFRDQPGDDNLWERFTRHEKSHPGRAEVGTVHFATNSSRDYDWGNPRQVVSRCDTWHDFPDLQGEARRVACSEWGNGDIRRHHKWWLSHFPCLMGENNGISYNWWQYVVDTNLVS